MKRIHSLISFCGASPMGETQADAPRPILICVRNSQKKIKKIKIKPQTDRYLQRDFEFFILQETLGFQAGKRIAETIAKVYISIGGKIE
jgi:hypothetical protein